MPSPTKGRTSAMSYSATEAESIAAPCSLLGPLPRKASTAARDPEVLRVVARARDGYLGVYGSTVEPGQVAVGDPVIVES